MFFPSFPSLSVLSFPFLFLSFLSFYLFFSCPLLCFLLFPHHFFRSFLLFKSLSFLFLSPCILILFSALPSLSFRFLALASSLLHHLSHVVSFTSFSFPFFYCPPFPSLPPSLTLPFPFFLHARVTSCISSSSSTNTPPSCSHSDLFTWVNRGQSLPYISSYITLSGPNILKWLHVCLCVFAFVRMFVRLQKKVGKWPLPLPFPSPSSLSITHTYREAFFFFVRSWIINGIIRFGMYFNEQINHWIKYGIGTGVYAGLRESFNLALLSCSPFLPRSVFLSPSLSSGSV